MLSFTGLELSSEQLLARRMVSGPFPANWEYVVVRDFECDTQPLIRWVMANTHGCFGIIASYPEAAVYFQDSNDALLFHLRGGMDEWKNAPTNPF